MSANSELLERYVELYNAGDLDAVMDLYAEDAVQIMPEGTFEGRDAIRERLARDLIACPDIDWTVLSFVEHAVAGRHRVPCYRQADRASGYGAGGGA